MYLRMWKDPLSNLHIFKKKKKKRLRLGFCWKYLHPPGPVVLKFSCVRIPWRHMRRRLLGATFRVPKSEVWVPEKLHVETIARECWLSAGSHTLEMNFPSQREARIEGNSLLNWYSDPLLFSLIYLANGQCLLLGTKIRITYFQVFFSGGMIWWQNPGPVGERPCACTETNKWASL